MKKALVALLALVLLCTPLLTTVGCTTVRNADGSTTTHIDPEALAQAAIVAQQMLVIAQQSYQMWMDMEAQRYARDQAAFEREQAARQQQIAFLREQAELLLAKLPPSVRDRVQADATELANTAVEKAKDKAEQAVLGVPDKTPPATP